MRYFQTSCVLLFFVCGCEGFGPPPHHETDIPHYDITMEVGDHGFLYAITQDGVYYTDETEFTSVLMAYQTALDAEGVELRLVPGPELATHLDDASSSYGLDDGVGVSRESLDGPIWGAPWLYFSTGCGYEHVAGCVSRPTGYCAVRLRDRTISGNAGLVFDVHAAAWTDAGRACFGLYDSGRSHFVNSCTCSPSARDFGERMRQISDALYGAFLSVGLTVAGAAAMARMLAPIAAAGLVAL
ncbi:hypothetical protein IT087_01745 [Candidatus Uhrbacteria bacterium]|nr:hypothetical protein [Candidatus Uhrbacteria bacterium]